MTYESKIDHVYYIMRFIDGLKDYVKASILVQRLSYLDIACAIALLKDEVAKSARKDYRKPSYMLSSKPFHKGALPLPPPPATDKSFGDASRAL